MKIKIQKLTDVEFIFKKLIKYAFIIIASYFF